MQTRVCCQPHVRMAFSSSSSAALLCYQGLAAPNPTYPRRSPPPQHPSAARVCCCKPYIPTAFSSSPSSTAAARQPRVCCPKPYIPMAFSSSTAALLCNYVSRRKPYVPMALSMAVLLCFLIFRWSISVFAVLRTPMVFKDTENEGLNFCKR